MYLSRKGADYVSLNTLTCFKSLHYLDLCLWVSIWTLGTFCLDSPHSLFFFSLLPLIHLYFSLLFLSSLLFGFISLTASSQVLNKCNFCLFLQNQIKSISEAPSLPNGKKIQSQPWWRGAWGWNSPPLSLSLGPYSKLILVLKGNFRFGSRLSIQLTRKAIETRTQGCTTGQEWSQCTRLLHSLRCVSWNLVFSSSSWICLSPTSACCPIYTKI